MTASVLYLKESLWPGVGVQEGHKSRGAHRAEGHKSRGGETTEASALTQAKSGSLDQGIAVQVVQRHQILNVVSRQSGWCLLRD